MEIVFCERCGVSIPEHQIAGARQASGGRDLCATCSGPAAAAEGDLRLYFCENCRVSIAVSEVITGQARADGTGYMCAVCSDSTPADRVARRVAMEREMTEGPANAGVPVPLHDARVPVAAGDDDAAPAVGATPPSAGSAPLHFCEGCNASIAASEVSLGRALMKGGRTWCQKCRVRVEDGSDAPGAGALPVLAAALLASMTTAAVFVVWEGGRMEDRQKVDQEIRAEIASVQSSLRDDRLAADDSFARVENRIDAVSGNLLDEMDGLRGTMKEQTNESKRLRALMGAGKPGQPNRFDVAEARMGDLEGSMQSALDELGTRFEKRLVDVLAEARAAAEEAAEKAAFEPVAPADTGGNPGVPAPAEMSEQVQRALELLADKDAGVRFSAAIELGKLGDRRAWTELVEVLQRDDDVFVRRACVRSLGELKAYEAFPALIEALTDSEEYVAKQASSVVREMAGQDFGYKQSQSKSERKRVADRANKWWEENQDRV
ncbi:MAG: HEAT repeat domain-containing protein, partial [Planctomycetota bacterium]